MDKVIKPGQMEPLMQVNGNKTEHMAKENLFMQTVMCMKDSGKTTKPMDRVCTSMLTELFTKESGRMTSNMAKEQKPGLISHTSTENTNTVENTVLAFTDGLTAQATLGSGTKIKFVASAFIAGQMDASTKALGLITIWMVRVSITGLMEGLIEVNTDMIRNTGLALTNGLTSESTRGTGTEANNMALEPIMYPKKEKQNMVYGKTENESNGLMKNKQTRFKVVKDIC